MQGQCCPKAHTPPAPLTPLLDSFLLLWKYWRLLFWLLNTSSSGGRQVLAQVFLKGKLTKQSNHHLQSQGAALAGHTPPHPTALLASRVHLD